MQIEKLHLFHGNTEQTSINYKVVHKMHRHFLPAPHHSIKFYLKSPVRWIYQLWCWLLRSSWFHFCYGGFFFVLFCFLQLKKVFIQPKSQRLLWYMYHIWKLYRNTWGKSWDICFVIVVLLSLICEQVLIHVNIHITT